MKNNLCKNYLNFEVIFVFLFVGLCIFVYEVYDV